MKDKLVILISSPESYRDVFDINADLFKKIGQVALLKKFMLQIFFIQKKTNTKDFK